MKTLVVGSGIAGLSYAFYSRANVKLVGECLGGWIQTKRTPHVLELGPRSLRPGACLDLVRLLNIPIVSVPKNHPAAKNRFILHNGQIMRMGGLNLLTFRLILSMLCEPFQPKGLPGESIHDFFTRRFGSFVAHNFISALVHGIYAGDFKQLEMQSTFTRFSQMEQTSGSIVLHMIKSPFQNRQSSQCPSDKFIKEFEKQYSIYSFENGIYTLVEKLLASLQIKTNCDIQSGKCHHINLSGSRPYAIMDYGGGQIKEYYDHIVSAMPANDLAAVLDDPISSVLRQIEFVNVAVINLVFRGHVLKLQGFGYLCPQTDDPEILGVVFDSSCFPKQDIGSVTRLTVMAGGHNFQKRFGNPKTVSKDILLDVALSQVKKYLKVDRKLLVQSHVSVHENCIPQYTVGHADRLAKLWKWLETKPHFSLIGASYKGVAINDIVLNSKSEAERVDAKKLNLVYVFHPFLFQALKGTVEVRSLVTVYVASTQSKCINQIRGGRLGLEAVLVAVHDCGMVHIWYLDDLERQPTILENDGESTWGVALCGNLRIIAVSANSHKITLFRMITNEKQYLVGHAHNIPCLDYQEDNGLLISCSIDGSVKLWDLSNGNLIKSMFIGTWIWSCRFFKLADVNENRLLITKEKVDMEDTIQPILASDGSSKSSLGSISSIGEHFEIFRAAQTSNQQAALMSDDDFSKESISSAEDESAYIESVASDGLTEPGDFLMDEEAESPLTDLLVFASTKDSVLILDQNLTPVYIMPHVIRYESGPTGFERISFVEWLPKISSAVIASQRGKFAILNLWKTENRRIHVSKEIECVHDMILGLNTQAQVMENSMIQICEIFLSSNW